MALRSCGVMGGSTTTTMMDTKIALKAKINMVIKTVRAITRRLSMGDKGNGAWLSWYDGSDCQASVEARKGVSRWISSSASSRQVSCVVGVIARHR